MQFGLDEDQQMIVDTVQRFAQAQLAPGARERDEAEAFAADAVSSLAELGLMGMFVDAEQGGGGLDAFGGALVVEEIARYDAALAVAVVAHNAQATLQLATSAPAEVRQSWLDRLTSGAALAAWAGEARGVEARGEGGEVRLFGEARFVPLAAHAAGLVVSADAPDGRRSFWVEADAVTRTPVRGGLGLRAAGLAHVAFEGAPAVALEGPALPERVASMGRVLLGAVSVGVARGALEEARAYALERQQFKRPIAQFQAIQWKIADVATEVDAARLLVRRAATLVAVGDAGGAAAAAQARLLAADAAVRAAYEAIQVYGGNGFVREFPVERFYRDAQVLQGGFGSADALRREISSRALAAG